MNTIEGNWWRVCEIKYFIKFIIAVVQFALGSFICNFTFLCLLFIVSGRTRILFLSDSLDIEGDSNILQSGNRRYECVCTPSKQWVRKTQSAGITQRHLQFLVIKQGVMWFKAFGDRVCTKLL